MVSSCLTRSGQDFATFDGRPVGVNLRTGAQFALPTGPPVAQNHHCPGKSLSPIEIPLTVHARVPLGQAAGH